MTVTREMQAQMEAEVEEAIEDHVQRIEDENCEQIFYYKRTKDPIIWGINCCTVCSKPNILHQDPWGDLCSQEAISLYKMAEYIDFLENDKRIKL